MENKENTQNIQNIAGYPAFKTAMDSSMMYIALGDLNEVESNRLLETYKTVLRFFRTGQLPKHDLMLQEVYLLSLHPERFMALGIPQDQRERVVYDQKIIKHFIEKFYEIGVMVASPEEGVIAPLQLKRSFLA